MTLRTKKILAVIGVVLIANGLYRKHAEREQKRQRVEAIRLEMDILVRRAEDARRVQEEMNAILNLNRRPPFVPSPPPQPNPQLDELNQRLRAIEDAVRDADLNRSIEASIRP